MLKNLLLVSALLLATRAYAQPGSGGPTPPNPAAPTAVPLDGGATLLLASGVVYGLRHLRQRRRR